MFKCNEVQILWEKLKKWIWYFLKLKIDFNAVTVILNNYIGTQSKIVNTLILMLKRYIYVTKCKEENLSFVNFINTMFQIREIEYLTALRNEKTNIFFKKWKNVFG